MTSVRLDSATAPRESASVAAPLLRVIVFSLDRRRYAVKLERTVHVVPMVAITPLPGAPENVAGAVNFHGDVLPVLDVRRRLGLPAVAADPSARLLVARTARRVVALPVDDVLGLEEVEFDDVAPPTALGHELAHIAGIAAVSDGLILVHDLDRFLSLEEEDQLDKSLSEKRT